VKARAIIVAAILLGAPTAARPEALADSIPAKARMLADRGRAFHDAGDYARAIVAFTQAYVMAPSPALLFNLAQAYRLLGNCDDAALLYRRYLATGPRPEQRSLAEDHLATVERCADKLARHIPVATAATSLVVLPPLDVIATPTPAPAPAPSTRAQLEKDIGIGLMIGGGLALAGAVGYAVKAHDAADDVSAAFMKHAPGKDIAALDARGRAAAANAKLLGIGGALGVGSGVMLYVIGRRTETAPVAVVPTSHGVEVSMSWVF
jgi:tetratricopeptide (TPR) repeat protein